MDISEDDWKIWKALRLRTIDKFCHTTFERVQQLAAAKKPIHDRHRELYQLVTDRDREIEQLFDPLTRSRSVLQLRVLYMNGLVSDDEISLFSEDLQSVCRRNI